MVSYIMTFLRDGITFCMDIFSTFTTSTNTWTVILVCFIIVCIGSLISPFIYSIGSGFSDKARTTESTITNMSTGEYRTVRTTTRRLK